MNDQATYWRVILANVVIAIVPLAHVGILIIMSMPEFGPDPPEPGPFLETTWIFAMGLVAIATLAILCLSPFLTYRLLGDLLQPVEKVVLSLVSLAVLVCVAWVEFLWLMVAGFDFFYYLKYHR